MALAPCRVVRHAAIPSSLIASAPHNCPPHIYLLSFQFIPLTLGEKFKAVHFTLQQKHVSAFTVPLE